MFGKERRKPVDVKVSLKMKENRLAKKEEKF